jgi:hypothetical protein
MPCFWQSRCTLLSGYEIELSSMEVPCDTCYVDMDHRSNVPTVILTI